MAKLAGYAGYIGTSIIRMLYKAGKHGGLEQHLNKEIGCTELDKSPCSRYKYLKVIQVTEKGFLYSYSRHRRTKYYGTTIFADKTPGKMYLEGQPFENQLYVFKGMITYTTILGVRKSVPHFGFINLKQ